MLSHTVIANEVKQSRRVGADVWIAIVTAPYNSVSSLDLEPAGGVLVTLILTVWDPTLPLADLTS
jgi:hypothetical protein